ncbi:hypothetical protein [Geoglobus acetivorans]|uniref:DUF11 domain-containing protein n=1 Tax=Geoglobus acetivorans TaxID=565033 RepID=A0ABZ3H297_GEOAI|nr:hypothetical protein [Geoglobus acetivorans]
MRIVYGVILLVFSLTVLLGSSGNFREYGGERTAVYQITDNSSSFIAFSCPVGSLRVTNGDVVTVLTLTNNLNENAEFYITPDVNVLEFNNPVAIDAGDSADIQATYVGGEGEYTVLLAVDAVWANGSARVETCTINITDPTLEIEKVLLSGNKSVRMGEKEYWTYRIVLKNYGSDELLTVKDVVPAEFEVIGFNQSSGNVTVTQTGHGMMGASKILWIVNAGDVEYLDVEISTKMNPAGKQEFTSPGEYCMNNGAEIVEHGIKSNALTVIAEEK